MAVAVEEGSQLASQSHRDHTTTTTFSRSSAVLAVKDGRFFFTHLQLELARNEHLLIIITTLPSDLLLLLLVWVRGEGAIHIE